MLGLQICNKLFQLILLSTAVQAKDLSLEGALVSEQNKVNTKEYPTKIQNIRPGHASDLFTSWELYTLILVTSLQYQSITLKPLIDCNELNELKPTISIPENCKEPPKT